MSSKVPIKFNRYLTYAELTEFLEKVSAAYPGLASLESAGKSYEGRDIWVLTLTNMATAAPAEKPASYLDGNIHAGEVTASMSLLYLIDQLVEQYGKDETVTHLLDTRTFYINPRANPDGAELYLTTPNWLRSSVRPWPLGEPDEVPGLIPGDIDGDGKILRMRARDDGRGEWAVSDKDPRVMVPRAPGATSGPFYHVYPEGLVDGYSGGPVSVRKSIYGLDINRNFPQEWNPNLPGGGDYPTSEPEVKAIVDFILGHPNIGVAQCVHTAAGLYYRNSAVYPDDQMDQQDLRAELEIGALGTKISGYPTPRGLNRGTFLAWTYEHKGIISYTTELWNRYARAGVAYYSERESKDPEVRESNEIAVLKWIDKDLGGVGFTDWTPFDHPQLGLVEIGGFDRKFLIQNPPPSLLESECMMQAAWCMRQCAALPELHMGPIEVVDIDARTKRVSVLVENHGYLPTYISNKARMVGAVKPDVAEIIPSSGVSLVSPARLAAGFLDGYLNAPAEGEAKSASTFSWLVCVDQSASEGHLKGLTVEYRSQRGGTVRSSCEFE